MIRQQAVSLAVNILGSLRAGRLDQAEHFAGRFVVPVAQIRHVILPLNFHVARMRMRYGGSGQALHVVMCIEIKWQLGNPSNCERAS